ncbi:tyrosine/serine/threonine protein phosphatase pps1, partial [Rhizopus stolonifer]
DARQKKGICLIHCRVGVSRSAAIAICYVMKHLNLGLVEAYLFVRARRLNVIIQPNLKFMYEMLQLEQQRSGTITMTWPVLCNEINHLNALYKDCLEAEK